MDFFLHLLSATLLGTLIGLERQWHQRFAGLRTNALVSLGAAAFAGASLSVAAGGNPSPMLGQIITGIGFLGAGVIFKEDFNVRGLNTAATIWCSAAVGMLCGLGLLPYAGATAAIVIVVNVALRPLVRKLGEMPATKGSESQTVYAIHILGTKKSELRLRTALVRATTGARLTLRNLHSQNAATNRVRVTAELSLYGRDDHRIEAVASQLGMDASVESLRWELVKADNSFE
jgi:putative Mg2+ transporter-C (MgtC) family protein